MTAVFKWSFIACVKRFVKSIKNGTDISRTFLLDTFLVI